MNLHVVEIQYRLLQKRFGDFERSEAPAKTFDIKRSLKIWRTAYAVHERRYGRYDQEGGTSPLSRYQTLPCTGTCYDVKQF